MKGSYKFRNPKVFYSLEALFEKIGHGEVNVKFVLYNKRITSITVYGKQSYKFG